MQALRKAPEKTENRVVKLTYTDSKHAYFLDGKRAKGVTTVAKIPEDRFKIELWAQRQVAVGMAVDATIVENVACHLDNKDRLGLFVEDAKRAAKAHQKADRGTQMHRVLELILLGREMELLTAQQRRDAEVLKRTLDRYKLTPHLDMIEQFVVWPQHVVAGRFDAVLERPDGRKWLVDLKTGKNAITYPHSTAVQLALYARAPHVSMHAPQDNDRQTCEQWHTMPERLDLKYARVLLCEPDANAGTLHRIDIEHGWSGACSALQIVKWRKIKDIVSDELAEDTPASDVVKRAASEYEVMVDNAQTLDELIGLWRAARWFGHDSQDFIARCAARKNQLLAAAG